MRQQDISLEQTKYYPEIKESWWYDQPWEYNRNCNLTYSNSRKILVLIHYKNYNKQLNICYLPFIYKDIKIVLSQYG